MVYHGRETERRYMPELPEVERGRRIAEAVAAGRRVKAGRVRQRGMVEGEAAGKIVPVKMT